MTKIKYCPECGFKLSKVEKEIEKEEKKPVVDGALNKLKEHFSTDNVVKRRKDFEKLMERRKKNVFSD